MADVTVHPRYKVGDKVRLAFGSRLVSTVTEVQGLQSPTGRILYRVRVPITDAEPLWIPAREDEIEKA